MLGTLTVWGEDMTLSPKQREIVECLKRHGARSLPEDSIVPALPFAFAYLVFWAWSWEICQQIKSADYRRRIHELREKGYVIESFHIGKRHGYALVAEALEKERAA